ncbi:deoxyguanosinetriphosphate triphosphohydrolase [Solicola sp. PLA-1-18]|uniref:deoxyguanosinetriphosphate triphosphohydrolase n=1 Tax=Solicola sp. PLA-1-18 TaxID=3380532 RepID=UPI003B76809D
MSDTDGPYGEEARERLVPEPAKRTDRTSFERDRARVLHGAALRRLSAKTQVLGPATDFVRNRLTHSLEVAQVARELGKSLGCDPDVVDSAALAHDLGHPPFGHNGERALHQAAVACGGFEGNAQTLRILTRLESKTFDAGGASVGLNLTRATLDACVKYPWGLDDAPDPLGRHGDGTRRAVRKFGVYEDDRRVFDWCRAGTPGVRQAVEAQVMDLADDVAYSVHDVEDAVVGGWVGLDQVRAEAADVWVVARDWYAPDSTDAGLDEALGRLTAMPEWPTGPFDGGRHARGALKGLTSALVGRFVSSVLAATRERHGTGRLVRHHADVVVPDGTRDEIVVLKAVAAHFVMRTDERVAVLRDQRELVTALVERLSADPEGHLEPELAEDHAAATDDAARLRVVVDQVASLTDVSARTWGERLLD